MMDSTQKTIESYNKHGINFAKEYREHLRVPAEKLKMIFDGCSRILEIGVGSGADLACLLSCGYDVTGFEPSETFIKESYLHFPETKGLIHQVSVPMPEEDLDKWSNSFDGIHCSAVIMHIAEELRASFIQQCVTMLKPTGRIHLVLSENRDGLDENGFDAYGRLYEEIGIPDLVNLAESYGLRKTLMEDLSSFKRSRGNCWKRLVLELIEK